MSSNSLSFEAAASFVLETLKNQGVAGEVIIDGSSEFTLKASERELSEVSASSSQVIGVRVIKDQKTAITSSESFTTESLAQMIEDAIALASLSKSSPENELMNIKNSPQWQSEVTAPPEEVELAQKTQLALALESEVLEKSPAVKAAPYNGYHEVDFKRMIASTEGLMAELSSKQKSCYTSALIESEKDQAMSYWSSRGRVFNDLRPNECIEKSYERAAALIGAGPLKSGKYDIIFETDVHQSFWSLFSNIFSAKAMLQGQNPLGHKLKGPIASELLTITDRPLVTGGMKTQFFDDEGGLSKDVKLLCAGHLNSLIHNHQSATALKMENNFRAARSPKGHLGVGHTHFCIEAGSSDQGQLLEGSEVLIITSIQGAHSGASNISGDFSCGASGLLYRNGNFERAFKGVTLSGNWWQMLEKQVALVGNEVEAATTKSFFAPLIRWHSVQIGGE